MVAMATPKAMTLAQVETSTMKDKTLQAVILAIHSSRWEAARRQHGVDIATFYARKRVKEDLAVAETGRVILRGSRLLIPRELQKQVVDLAHAGHLGIVKTKGLLREKVWFSEINVMVEKMVRSCMACQVATPTPARE